MTELVPISEAKGRLSELVRDADTDDVLLMKHGRKAAVLMSTRRHEALLEELEDLRDRQAIDESRDDVTVSWNRLKSEIGL